MGTRTTIGNYELGRRHVGLDDLYKIADALNKPYSYFFGVDKQVEEQTRRKVGQKVRRGPRSGRHHDAGSA